MTDSLSFETLFKSYIIPVLVVREVELAVPVAKILLDSGLPTMEITLRTEAALPSIKRVSDALPEAIVGAGTVYTPDQLSLARDSGAAFAVSPGTSKQLYESAINSSLPFLPGVSTPSEILKAREVGFTMCKIFPSEKLGGVEMIKTLAEIFPDMKFCPTGGVSEANLASYLSLTSVPVVAGSWIAPESLIIAKDWIEIEKRSRRALELVDRLGKN